MSDLDTPKYGLLQSKLLVGTEPSLFTLLIDWKSIDCPIVSWQEVFLYDTTLKIHIRPRPVSSDPVLSGQSSSPEAGRYIQDQLYFPSKGSCESNQYFIRYGCLFYGLVVFKCRCGNDSHLGNTHAQSSTVVWNWVLRSRITWIRL